jgi:hypothetical protein
MLMQSTPKIDLDPMKRPPLKWDRAMQYAIERAQYQPRMRALQSNVRDTVYDATRFGRG